MPIFHFFFLRLDKENIPLPLSPSDMKDNFGGYEADESGNSTILRPSKIRIPLSEISTDKWSSWNEIIGGSASPELAGK